jgi:hypothetical protein
MGANGGKEEAAARPGRMKSNFTGEPFIRLENMKVRRVWSFCSILPEGIGAFRSSFPEVLELSPNSSACARHGEFCVDFDGEPAPDFFQPSRT